MYICLYIYCTLSLHISVLYYTYTIGCLAQLLPERQSSNNTNTNIYKLKDLTMLHTNNHPYLQHPSTLNPRSFSGSGPATSASTGTGTGIFKMLYVYCAIDKSSRNNQLAVLSLFIVDQPFTEPSSSSYYNNTSTNNNAPTNSINTQYSNNNANNSNSSNTNSNMSGKSYVWLISGRGNMADSKPPLQKIYRKFETNSNNNIKFNIKYILTLNEAYNACNEVLVHYIREKHGPSIG